MEHKEKQPHSKSKVSSFTQVDPEYVGDFREIIGQTNISDDFASSSILTQNVSLRKQSKGVRPPLVGQASSSSNDSVSISFVRRHTEPPEQISPSDRRLVESEDILTSIGNLNYTRGSFSTTPMLNRDDYINQKPPEGSSEQENAIVLQSLDHTQDFPRVRSPSSVSSVTSGRPLEWDSLADVGYNNVKPCEADDLSSLERGALAFGTGLLTRSDPEGTTAPNGQSQPIIKTQFKPLYKSTPMGTTCVTSDVSPETVSEDFSPIPPFHGKDKIEGSNFAGSESDSAKEPLQKKLSVKLDASSHTKTPLFPEIINRFPQTDLDLNDNDEGVKENISDMNNLDENNSLKSDRPKLTDNPIIQNRPSLGKNNSRHIVTSEDENITALNSSTKKQCSSLENITSTGGSKTELQGLSNTLPRSQSQLNLHEENLNSGNRNNFQKFPQHYTIALHSLVQYNKSASSSSIATVVHKKGDSPKHVLAQNSVVRHETVGVQVSEADMKGEEKCRSIGRSFIETPHLPKSFQQPHPSKRSNYFNIDTVNSSQHLKHNPEQCQRFLETCKIKMSSNIHSHNGVPCTGAHRKSTGSKKSEHRTLISSRDNQSTSNQLNLPSNLGQNNAITFRSSSGPSVSADNKVNFRTDTLESVESSARSGGCWTDKQYSVTVEDRVNSFEYLPGHVYENNERQPPMDSRATSSISIQNQTSNNDTPDDEDKLWDSSESVASTLDKYAQKGVDMFTDFVKGSCPNDSAMKKKLIRKVVEKLISNNYNDDRVRPMDIAKNVPWVPSLPQNVERNGRETRRSVNRSKVPCEFSSRSEKSASTNASSECFIPCPAASSSILPSSLRENGNTAGNANHSSTSEISLEKSSKAHGKPIQTLDVETEITEKQHKSKSEHSKTSDEVSVRGDWKHGPLTKSERILEEKKRKKTAHKNEEITLDKLEQCLKIEQENQLFWIQSQIQHLNKFKELLEKQKHLKRCLKSTGSSQKSPGKSVLKNRNVDRPDGSKLASSTSNQISDIEKQSSSRRQARDKHQPTLGAWLEKVTDNSKADTTVSSAISTDPGTEDWASHHYKIENDDQVRTCVKKKYNHDFNPNNVRNPSERRRNQVIYDEPPVNGSRDKSELEPPIPHRPTSSRISHESAPPDKGILRGAAVNAGEPIISEGPKPTKSNKQQTLQRKESCVCLNRCQCCHPSLRQNGGEEEKAKAAVGYYITFEPSPRAKEKSTNQHKRLEEVRIPVPMSEPKMRPPRRLKTRLGIRANEDLNAVTDTSESEKVKATKGAESGTDSGSNYSDKENELPNSGRPIYKGGMGSLQECLLRNRPVYVSRAEDRRQCIAQMQYLRELREQSKQRLLTLTEPKPAEPIPPPPLSVRRVFSQQTMRRQTEKKYRQLAEVKGKQLDAKRKEGYRTNRLMAEIFTKKLQKRVLKGDINLSNSVSVISSF